MCEGQLDLGQGKPVLQKTRLGWLVVGDTLLNSHSTKFNSSFLATASAYSGSFDLEKFWEIEEVNIPKRYNPNEERAEQHFVQTFQRAPDGHFIVRLPFSKDASILGHSYNAARAKWFAVERQLHKNSELEGMYTQFMLEYESLGHMSEIEPPLKEPHYFLPHFHVLKLDSTSTKLRVVFNASAPTSTGFSLNDVLLVGPTIQPELVRILLRFRSHEIAICADISKMYRRIEVAEEDRKWQLIVYRRPGDKKASVFQLNTVTYGTSSAPFLAVRCVVELAKTESQCPLAVEVLLRDMYVDNLISGSQSVVEAMKLFEQVNVVMEKGQMPMRKWYTNHPEVLKQIPDDMQDTTLNINDSEIVKTLGMIWIPASDQFTFKYEATESTDITKRNVLSQIAKIFDPLGLVAPVVVKAKMFMQYLCTTKLDWDDNLTSEDQFEWLKFRDELTLLSEVKIPRFIYNIDMNPSSIQFHAFADASIKAYAAAIYVRYQDIHQNYHVQLLIAKTRVAPVKTISLPRLELCAALLLAELIELVRSSWPATIGHIYCWSDSTITLTWIRGPPNRWTQYVANRVTKIQDLTKNCTWNHVASKDNPADVASRGVMPSKITTLEMWYEGPMFLKDHEDTWFTPSCLPDLMDVPEQRKISFTFLARNEADLVEQCKYHNDLVKLQKIFGYVARFIHNIRSKTLRTRMIVSSDSIKMEIGHMNNGLMLIVRAVQFAKFNELYMALSNQVTPAKDHSYEKLQPFMENKIIRVGGRLNEATIDHDAKHQMLLPKHHPLTKSVVSFFHFRSLHAGPQLTLALTRQKFWPIGGKVLASKVVRECITCRRCDPHPFVQVMGDLPKARIEPYEKCFHVSGVDFCGPFEVKQRGRGRTHWKVYIAVFVCFTTKAVHLEVVDDLTTEGFISCLQRFCARRGFPKQIWSDNATTFVGTKAKLDIMCNNATRDNDMGAVFEWCRIKNNIEWHFIPPRTPHQGGLWEAAVRLAKLHLKKVLGTTILHQKDFETIVIMIEGVLNSRPLTPLTMHPSDEAPLTPGHFICGVPITNLPETDLTQGKLCHLRRWQLTAAIKQNFWKRWSTEYLQSLQQRQKWSQSSANVKEGTLVVMVNKETPAFTWEIGRIDTTFPGKDGKIRVVDVKTNRGTYRRGIHQLCPILEE